jgi:uncharacterized UBP type Zn finger protein
MISGRPMAQGTLTVSPNGSAPRCEHLDGLAPVVPQRSGCRDCQARGDRWVALLFCLSCGWVACSDDSPGRHAKAHYEETDHPVARFLEPGAGQRWCYVHGRPV